MKLGIMQPYFFPYLGYWQLINAVDKYVVYDDVAFIKGGWISRNNILLEGHKYMITLPLDNPSSFRNINQIDITSREVQRAKVIRTLEAAYRKAPYYETIMPMINNLIMESKSISELNYNSIIQIDDYLGIETEIILSSDLKKNNELKGQEKVLHICKLLGADMYLNAVGGKELYSSDAFFDKGIELRFLKMSEVNYKQYNDEFVPGLSIIDVLMFNSVDKVIELLNQYTLEKN